MPRFLRVLAENLTSAQRNAFLAVWKRGLLKAQGRVKFGHDCPMQETLCVCGHKRNEHVRSIGCQHPVGMYFGADIYHLVWSSAPCGCARFIPSYRSMDHELAEAVASYDKFTKLQANAQTVADNREEPQQQKESA